MPELFKFQQEDDCCEECPTCDLLEGYKEIILNSDTEDEVFELLFELFTLAKEIGYKECLHDSISAQVSLLKELECGNGCDCEDGCELES